MQPLTNRWYPRLKPNDKDRYSLFNSIPRSQASNLFLVYSMNEEGYRSYAAFRSATEFYHYYITVEEPEIHEIILGEKSQKCRFDIDLTPDKAPDGMDLHDFGDQIREAIFDSMRDILKTYNVELDIGKHIVYCTSHSKVKYSAHLILAYYYHNNYEEALTFFDQIINNDELLKIAVKNGIIDRSIYSTNHSMRLLGSYKSGVRVKSLVNDIIHHNEVISFSHPSGKHANLMKFRRSCITDTVGCKYLPVIVPIKVKMNISNVILPAGYEDIIMELLVKYEGGKENYEIRGVTDAGLIDLKRKHPSYCKICKRTHEKIDPFLRITPGGVVNYYCRQSSGGREHKHLSKMIGLIKVDKPPVIPVEPETLETKSPVKLSAPIVPSIVEDIEEVEDVDEVEDIKETIEYEGCNFDLLRSMSRQSYSIA